MRQGFAGANLTDQSALNQPVLREGYGLDNIKKGLENRYYPQQQDILLSDAWNRQLLRQQQNRFSDPNYQLIQWLRAAGPQVRNAWIAQRAPEVQQQINQLLAKAQNGTYDPARTEALEQSRNLLSKYSPNQGMMGGDDVPPIINTGAFGSTGIAQPQGAFGSTGIAQPQGAFNIAPPATGAFQAAAENQAAAGSMTSEQNKRVQAGARLESAISQVNKLMPDALKYAGVAGVMGNLGDTFKSAVSGVPGVSGLVGQPSPEYQNYEAWKSAMEGFLAEYKQVLGSRATDQAAKEINRIGNIELWKNNPDQARALFANYTDIARKLDTVNKLPVAQQMKEERIKEILKPREGLDPEQGMYWIKGNPYTLNQLKQMKSEKKTK